jgi:hypothetical protein
MADEPTIGPYRVHPVAAMFPLLTGEEFERFKSSIEDRGQLDPIIVLGDQLIDGRNRLRACLELELEPRIEEYSSESDPARFILAANITRRHLTPDQRAQISMEGIKWIAAHARERQLSGKSADGAAGGRGRKNLNPKSDSGSGRDLKAMNANSTVGQVADAAKTTRYKAEQAMKVAAHSKELAAQVIAGEKTLADAVKEVPAPKPKAKRKPKVFVFEKAVASAVKLFANRVARVPSGQREAFIEGVRKELRAL